MIIVWRTQFHVYLPWGQRLFSINSVLNIGAFSVIVQLHRLIVYTALIVTQSPRLHPATRLREREQEHNKAAHCRGRGGVSRVKDHLSSGRRSRKMFP